jgi:type 1 fimbriae regulatory protein FimB/type 1 fimbriae regulatory protein FimE
MKTSSLATAPTTDSRTVPLRLPNSALRTREHLTLAEVEKLIEAARGNRHAGRDALMILLAFRHGLRGGGC